MDWRAAAGFVQTVVDEIRANNITFMAGNIAHSDSLTLLPLLSLLVVGETVNLVIHERETPDRPEGAPS